MKSSNDQKQRRAVSIWLLVLLNMLMLMPGTYLMAHGDLHSQIAYHTKLIEQDPKNAQRYFDRGEAYRRHEELDAALADYERARQLEPDLSVIALGQAQVMLAAKRFLVTRVLLDGYIKQHPQDIRARVTRARALVALKEPEPAIADYTVAIDLSQRLEADYYLERSRIVADIGTQHIKRAVEMLDEGMERFGPFISLQLYAIELEVLGKDYSGAISRVNRIMDAANRKERWLAQRGDILMLDGQKERAVADYRESLKHIEELPYSRRGTPDMVALKNELDAKLKKDQL